MGDLLRFGVSIEGELLESFDRLIADRGYGNRSEALRDLIRDALVQSRLAAQEENLSEVLGSLTLVYDHHASELSERMISLQHDNLNLVISTIHFQVNRDDCMEVIVLCGRASDVRRLADSLLGLKGVKHGKLFVTLPARDIITVGS